MHCIHKNADEKSVRQLNSYGGVTGKYKSSWVKHYDRLISVT